MPRCNQSLDKKKRQKQNEIEKVANVPCLNSVNNLTKTWKIKKNLFLL